VSFLLVLKYSTQLIIIIKHKTYYHLFDIYFITYCICLIVCVRSGGSHFWIIYSSTWCPKKHWLFCQWSERKGVP